MKRLFDRPAASLLAISLLTAGCTATTPPVQNGYVSAVPRDRLPAHEVTLDLAEWPVIGSAVPAAANAATEARIDAILAKMTLAEKVGQILQPEITNITPDEVRQYHIGSVLNGGNGRPNKDTRAPASEWLKLADAYWAASTDKRGGGSACRSSGASIRFTATTRYLAARSSRTTSGWARPTIPN